MLGTLLSGIRWTKGAGYLDFYAVLLKPIFPVTPKREWIQEGDNIEKHIRLKLLEADNIRLRRALFLQEFNDDKRISAVLVAAT